MLTQTNREGKDGFYTFDLSSSADAPTGNWRAVVSFTLPNYVGSVRIMVVAARGNAYGSVEKTVPVKTDLMVLPTLPRVLRLLRLRAMWLPRIRQI